MRIDPNDLDRRDLYRLMISVVVPRPIAWATTVSPDGVTNAAPFSYFQALSSQPPFVMIAIGNRRTGEHKDTHANLAATGEFVVNVVSEESAWPMVKCAVDHPPEVSEFDEVGLTPVASEIVKPPRIGECKVALECKVDRILEIGTSAVCIGEVVLFHVSDDVLGDGGTADPAKLRPLGRLGGSHYAPLRDIVSITTEEAPKTVASELVTMWRSLRDRRRNVVAAALPEERARIAPVVKRLERLAKALEELADVSSDDARAQLVEGIETEASGLGWIGATLRQRVPGIDF